MKSAFLSKYRISRAGAAIIVTLFLSNTVFLFAGDRLLIQLRDFSKVEVKSGGFALPKDAVIHINALGAGKKQDKHRFTSDLFAYAWIINANNRERVWEMDYDNTESEGKDRLFDHDVNLPAGSYELYFVAYGFQSKSGLTNIEMNIDRREKRNGEKIERELGPFSWFYNFFTDDMYDEWMKRSKTWGIDLYVKDSRMDVVTFTTPKEFPNVLFKSVKAGEDEQVKQGFVLSKSMPIRIYALGEKGNDEELADYGWIVDAKSRKRVWEMTPRNVHTAGGADKNKMFDETLTLSAGEYIVSYVTDDSHSYLDWNSAPPDDPFNYGITLMASNEADKASFKLSEVSDFKNIIVELTKVRDDEMRKANFSLLEDMPVRIYAVGERYPSQREMADFGWIINARTREKVWTMEVDHTEHAGGAAKNRVEDDVITLPKGTYTVFYKTDGSHSYKDWNSAAPIEPERWGITIMGEGDHFDMSKVEKNVTAKEAGVIAQIIHVGDGADKTQKFSLDQATKVRVYAIGEGQNREMYDYGWIENVRTGERVWEMTYSMTFHAGGGRKNRIVNTSIMLEKGNYELHYVSDDSHSYKNWNTDPPEDPDMWGITLYRDDQH